MILCDETRRWVGAFIFMCSLSLACGVSTIEISPPLSQTTWVTGYVGNLYSINFAGYASPLTWQWKIDQQGLPSVLLNSSSSQCTNISNILTSNFTTKCSGGTTTLITDQPLQSDTTIELTATGTRYSVQLSATLNLRDCQIERNFSDALSPPNSCGFNCVVNYQCKPGYISGVGDRYQARCSQSGNLEPPDPCIFVPPSGNGLLLPTWAIVLISVGGGLILLAIAGVVIWKFCRRD